MPDRQPGQHDPDSACNVSSKEDWTRILPVLVTPDNDGGTGTFLSTM